MMSIFHIHRIVAFNIIRSTQYFIHFKNIKITSHCYLSIWYIIGNTSLNDFRSRKLQHIPSMFGMLLLITYPNKHPRAYLNVWESCHAYKLWTWHSYSFSSVFERLTTTYDDGNIAFSNISLTAYKFQ